MTQSRPMMTGPTMREPVTRAPASIRTRPMISLVASTVPSFDGSIRLQHGTG